MEKEFLTYPLSFLAKEKGFTEPCFAYFSNNGWYRDKNGATVLRKHSFQIGSILKPFKVSECNAPLWQQIIVWLREKHIRVVETPQVDDECWLVVLDTKAPKKLKDTYESPGFLTLEKAVETALNLI